MSYDLYLYKQKNKDLTEDDVAEYLNKNLPFNSGDYNKQWVYDNPETGVYFVIELNEPNTDEEDLGSWDNFDDFVNLNFNISINFYRPTYFALEVFPIIDRILKKLDLYIINPQDENDSENPQKFPDGYLQDQWIRHNNQASIQSFKELDFDYMPLEKSNYMWWYLLHREELEQGIKEDIYIPRFFIIKSHADKQLYTACAWPNHIPILLPKVDYLIVQKKYKKFFRSVEESGLVSYENIMESLGHYFEEFDYPSISNLKILKQNNADKMVDKFNSLKIYKSVEEFGTGVGRDRFVNVYPE